MRNTEHDNQLRKERRLLRRAMAIQLLGGKCVDCGSTENLEFDHIKNDREGLRNTISQLFTSSIERLVNELEKCQLLCVSCHGKKTRKDNGFQEYRHGMLSMYMNKRCRCDDCRAIHADYMRTYKLGRRIA